MASATLNDRSGFHVAPLAGLGQNGCGQGVSCAPLEHNDMPRRTVKKISRVSDNRSLRDALEQQGSARSGWRVFVARPLSRL
jgi:hypothetical protein